MANFFDQFDETGAPKAAPGKGGNFFDQFDAPEADVGYNTAAGRAFTKGASFGLRDEGSGLIAAGGGDPNDPNVASALFNLARGGYRKLTGDPEAQRLYDAEVARQRAQTKQIEQQYPGTSLAGEVLGAVAFPIGGALRAPTMVGRMGRGAAIGAGTGALTGFGEGEGTAGSLTGAAIGAPLGAGIGAAAVPLVEGAVRGAGALISKPASIIAGNLNPERAAQRAVGRATEEAIRADPGGLQRLTAGQLTPGGEAMVADVLGEPGRRLARSASNISGEAAERLNQAIDPRLEAQAGRIGRWIDDSLSFPNAHAQQQALEATQRTANSAAYRRAYQQGAGGLWSPELERLASSDAVSGAMRTAVKSAQDEAVVGGAGGFNPKISFTPDGRIQFNRGPTGVPTYPDLQYWDQVRRELSDAAIRAGRGTEEARRLGRFATALNSELDRMVPTYAQARRTAASFFGAENALDAGQKFATQRFGNQEARQALARMSDTERALFRDGYASRMKDVIASQSDRTDLVRKIAHTPAAREKMEIALGRQRANELIAMMHGESIMQKLTRGVQGNSTTAMQLIGAGGAGAGAGGFLGYDPSTSGLSTALLVALKGRGDRAVAQHIARLLTSRDPQTLRQGIASLARSNRHMDTLGAIDAALGRIGAQQAAERTAPQQGLPQHAGAQMPFRPGEQEQNLMDSINGPQGYPDFHWVNPAGVDAFLASGPMSTNIEDRRDEMGGFDAAALRMRRQGRRLPGYADGGRPYADEPIVVGERGPEVFVPDQPGTVIPADDPWARAAARTGHRGRAEGAGTKFVEGGYGVPSLYKMLDEGAQKAFESGGKLQHYGNEYYDPAPVVAQALGAAGAPLVAPAMEGAVLGAGAIRRAAIPQAGKQALREAPYPQYATEYPPTAPPELKTDLKSGKQYLGKVASPQAEEFMKTREGIIKDMKQGYEPYYDPAERTVVDPSNYPGRNVDTLTIAPKQQKTIDKYMEDIGAPITRERLRAAYAKGQELGNANDWYFMGQLEKDFVKELGAKEGRKQFLERFASGMASTTSGNNPTTNLLMSQYLNFLKERGLPMPTAGHQLPSPVGGRYGISNVGDFTRMQEAGGYAGLGADQPKMHNFARSFIGDLDRAVMDDQMAKGMLGHAADPNLPDRARKQAFGLLEAPLHAEAAAAGVRPGAYQDVAWAGFKGEPGKPMISHINDAIERTHQLTGMPREEIVRRGLVRNEIPIYGFSAPMPGGERRE